MDFREDILGALAETRNQQRWFQEFCSKGKIVTLTKQGILADNIGGELLN